QPAGQFITRHKVENNDFLSLGTKQRKEFGQFTGVLVKISKYDHELFSLIPEKRFMVVQSGKPAFCLYLPERVIDAVQLLPVLCRRNPLDPGSAECGKAHPVALPVGQ